MSALIARRPRSTYTAAPEGLHAAVCCDVVNLGIVQGTYGPKHKVRIVWQIDVLDEARDRRFDVARVYTLSLHERAALRKDLESWRGRAFTEIELDGFDLEKLVGVNAQVQVTHTLGDDGAMYANVSTVVPPSKGVRRLEPAAYLRAKDRQARNGNAPQAEDTDAVPF